ncbi:MAG: response regulator [Gemmataceae bacterium]
MKPTLLIAEADHDLCGLYQRYFTLQGYSVETVHDGLECVGRLSEIRPDLLILGWELLWGGGEGVLGYMFHDERLKPIPVILLTTTLTPQLSEAYTDLVAQVYSKPCRLKALAQGVNTCLEEGNSYAVSSTEVCPQGAGPWLTS